VISADLRRPRFHEVFGLDLERGLAHVLGAVLSNVKAGGSGYGYDGARYSCGPTPQAAPNPNGKGGVWENLRKDRT
jgi:hypothetical protein